MRRTAAALVLSLSIVASGCGDDDGELSCNELEDRLTDAADEAMADLEETGELPDESEEVREWSREYEDRC